MNRKLTLAAVWVLISVPALFALADAVRFSIRNRPNGTLLSSGHTRRYLLHVPRSYDRAKPAPLVISMHGAGGWPVQQMELSLWNRLADEQGFLVVYPSAYESDGPRTWEVGRGPGLMHDVRFIADLIDELQADYNIDPRRIYANGLSNGGGMSFVLSCTLSDRIAAVGLVASAQTLPWSWCTDQRAVPMIAFHGTADPVTPYDGGTTWVSPRAFPAIPEWAEKWARRNRCAARSESAIAAGVTRRDYTNCADGANVTLVTIRGGGHTWPGGRPLPEWFLGPTSHDVDATREMWEFFRAHPLRRLEARRY